MAKTDYGSVDAYIAAQPEPLRPVLEEVRAAIRAALPGAQEVISYQIPAYRTAGGVVVYFAGWKQHYSLYPASDRMIAAFRDRLAPERIEKRTLQFPLDEPVPAALIGEISRFALQEQAERRAAKAAAKAAQPKPQKRQSGVM